MRAKLLVAGMIIVVTAVAAAQYTGDVLGQHQFSISTNSTVNGNAAGCLYCHAPHSGSGGSGTTALWNHKLSTATYIPYTSSTFHQKQNAQPPISTDSALCLACHDGTVGVGETVVYGTMPMLGTMNATSLIGGADLSNQHPLQPQHPFSLNLPLNDSVDLISTLATQGTTGDTTGAVKLVKGNVECTSCHDPHVENKDSVSLNFLVLDSSKGALCLSCHDPNRTVTGQVAAGQWQKNPLSLWTNSAHAQAQNVIASTANAGSYKTVAQNACISCHMPHNSPGPVRLTRQPYEQGCLPCHSGGSNVSPAAPNIFLEYTKSGNVGHPFPQGTNTHDAPEDLVAQNVVLNNNRHATCVDCHNVHSAYAVASITTLQPPTIRASQTGIAGVAADGVNIMNPAVSQYENCLRCHGNSTGKVTNPVFGYAPIRAVELADALNLIPQFATTSTSAHPVMFASSSAALPQPTLRPNILNLDGATPSRQLTSQIFCTDCHNNDDAREVGGASPNGPHGSKYSHILERQYLYNQTTTPGAPIPAAFLYPNPDLTASPNGTYALCAKCHNLNNLDQSWSRHLEHINSGFSCSVCHTAHGMGTTSATISGQRLVNFDVNIVAQNGSAPITYSYNGGNDSCTLTCHGEDHHGATTVVHVNSGLHGLGRMK